MDLPECLTLLHAAARLMSKVPLLHHTALSQVSTGLNLTRSDITHDTKICQSRHVTLSCGPQCVHRPAKIAWLCLKYQAWCHVEWVGFRVWDHHQQNTDINRVHTMHEPDTWRTSLPLLYNVTAAIASQQYLLAPFPLPRLGAPCKTHSLNCRHAA